MLSLSSAILSLLLYYQEIGVGILHKIDNTATPIKGIRFVAKATAIGDKILKNTIEIRGSLYNDNIDAVYFPTTTCLGEQYSLRYDTAKFNLVSIDCNVSYPKLVKISPKAKYDFRILLERKSTESKIRLGFDFYAVDKSFNIKHKSFSNLNIFDRPKNKQTVIWTDSVAIKE